MGSCYRFPFLLVDRVIEYNPGVSAVAIKNVTINDNFFPGHFPERPIMPGVLMIEVHYLFSYCHKVFMHFGNRHLQPFFWEKKKKTNVTSYNNCHLVFVSNL